MNIKQRIKAAEKWARENPGNYAYIKDTEYRCIVRTGSKTVRWYKGSLKSSRAKVQQGLEGTQLPLKGAK